MGEFNCSCDDSLCVCPKSVSIKDATLGVCETSDGDIMSWVKFMVELTSDIDLSCGNECIYRLNIKIHDGDGNELYDEMCDFNLLLATLAYPYQRDVRFWFQKTFMECIDDAVFSVCIVKAFRPAGYVDETSIPEDWSAWELPEQPDDLGDGWLSSEFSQGEMLEDSVVDFCDLPSTPTHTPTEGECCSRCDQIEVDVSQSCELATSCIPCDLSETIINMVAGTSENECTGAVSLNVEYDVVGTFAGELVIGIPGMSDDYQITEKYLIAESQKVHRSHTLNFGPEVSAWELRSIRIEYYVASEMTNFKYSGFTEIGTAI